MSKFIDTNEADELAEKGEISDDWSYLLDEAEAMTVVDTITESLDASPSPRG